MFSSPGLDEADEQSKPFSVNSQEGKVQKAFLCLISEHLRTSTYPGVPNTDVWVPGMEGLL